LFNLGFLKEYLLFSDISLLNNLNGIKTDSNSINFMNLKSYFQNSCKNFYENIIKNLIAVIDEMIK